MSDSSEDEDLSRFKEAVDNSFITLIHEAKINSTNSFKSSAAKLKSERYLEVESHYNDVKVPEKMQKQIGAKISAIIEKKVEYVDMEPAAKRKHKIKGGVKLFKDSSQFLSCEAALDTYTEMHNKESKKIKRKKRRVDPEEKELDENDKITQSTITGDYILSKEETKSWKSRRKEKLYKYKSQGKGKMLILEE